MKRIILLIMMATALIFSMSVKAQKQSYKANGAKSSDKSYVINTTDICSDIRGFGGPVPLEITVSKGKISGIKPLSNKETPRFFQRLREADFFNRWKGLTLKQASEKEVDACTGATYSSRAVIETVRKAAKSQLNKTGNKK